MSLPNFISSFDKKDGVIFLVFLSLEIILYLFTHKLLVLSDESAYAVLANQLVNGNYPTIKTTFSERYGFILPIALCIKLFGLSRFSMHLTSFLSIIGSSLAVFVSLKKLFPRVATMGFIVYCSLTWWFIYAQENTPDTLFASLSTVYLLLLLRIYQLKRPPISVIAMAASCLFFAFLVKEAVLVLGIFTFIYLIIMRLKHKLSVRIILGFLITEVVWIAFYFLLLAYFDSSLENRFSSIDNEFAKELKNEFSVNGALYLRLTKKWIYFLITSPYLFWIIPTCFISLMKTENHLLKWIKIYFWCWLLYLLFGTASFHQYLPLKLYERFWLPVAFPAVVILISFYKNKQNSNGVKIAANALFAIILLFSLKNKVPHFFHGIWFQLLIGTFLIGIFLHFIKRMRQFRYWSFFVLLNGFGLLFWLAHINFENDRERKALTTLTEKYHIQNLKIDHRLFYMKDIFFEGNIPAHLQLFPWNDSTKTGYFWVHNGRSEFLRVRKYDSLPDLNYQILEAEKEYQLLYVKQSEE